LPPPGEGRLKLKDIQFQNRSLGPLVEQLQGVKGLARESANLNPDLDPEALPREQGWKPNFLQRGAPRQHLDDNYVGEGDLFLFYGSFRETLSQGGLRFRPDQPERHCIYGWLQISAICRPGQADSPELPDFCASNPQIQEAASSGDAALYLATQRLKILGLRRQVPGGGVFKYFSNSLLLTAREAKSPGVWFLPHWLYPASRGKPPLSCHGSMDRWSKVGKGIQLTTAEKNEEFVLNSEFYPESRDWLRDLFALAETSPFP
jgi:hypothetical protein